MPYRDHAEKILKVVEDYDFALRNIPETDEGERVAF